MFSSYMSVFLTSIFAVGSMESPSAMTVKSHCVLIKLFIVAQNFAAIYPLGIYIKVSSL